jgi:hypothetical protein
MPRPFGGFGIDKMGTSFVKFHGRGFWSCDGYLEHLLFLLAEGIGSSPDETWLGELQDHWRSQASGAFSAWIHPQLDEYVNSEERLRTILELIEDVMLRADITEEVCQTAQLMRRKRVVNQGGAKGERKN